MTRTKVKIVKPTLAAVVTQELRNRITDGTFPPGTQMNEVELAARFETSRGPIREGMQRLVEEGLLVSEPHRGIWVRTMTTEDLEDLYFARAAVERAAMLRVAEHGASAALLADLQHDLAQMEHALAAGDYAATSAADLAFHAHIVQAARSERLSKMHATLAGQTRLGLLQLVTTYRGRSDLVDEHRELMRHLTTQNREGLVDALSRHFGDAVSTLLSTAELGGKERT